MTQRLDELITSALAARDQAYAPYSTFLVGAAILSSSQIFIGCNVENVSYGLTMCAERVALGNAVAAGRREFAAIAIASPGGVAPCGACRQALAEFAPRMSVYLVNSSESTSILEMSLSDLLPNPIKPGDLD